MNLDPFLHRFRLASRDLLNNHFWQTTLSKNCSWDVFDLFEQVEEVLFQTLVIQAAVLSSVRYGTLHSEINVCAQTDTTPIMINRQLGEDHGQWDFPITKIDRSATMKFVCFFDFDCWGRDCDHQYVKVEIVDWPSEPTTVGRRALIENQYVSFQRTSATSDQSDKD